MPDRRFDPREGPHSFWMCAGLAGALALPPVSDALGVPAVVSAVLVLSFGLGELIRVKLLLRPGAKASGAIQLSQLLHGQVVVIGLVGASGEPMTPLWALSTMYAAMDGLDYEVPPYLTHALAHTLSPLFAAPFFAAAGATPGDALGAAAFFVALNFLAYQYGATRKIAVRALFAARDARARERAHEEVLVLREELVGTLARRVGSELHALSPRAISASNDEGSGARRPPMAAEVAGAARRALTDLRDLLAKLDTPAPSRAEHPASAPRPLFRPYATARTHRPWSMSRRDLVTATALSALLAAVAALTPVARALGVDPVGAACLLGAFPMWSLSLALLARRIEGSPRLYRFAYWGSVLLGVTVATGVPATAHEPATALWALPVLYATFNGADYDVETTYLHLALHVLAPLAAIPFFLSRGAAPAAAIGVPVLFSVVCWMALHNGAMHGRTVREAREEKERLDGEIERSRGARRRQLLARDLHDTLGASLSLAAVYADLLEQRRDEPENAAALSEAITEATEQSLDDLRSLLEGLTPETSDLAALAELIRRRAQRLARAGGADLVVRVDGPAEVRVGADVRYALIRVAQEAIANALRHARAQLVEVELSAVGAALEMTVRDDGPGFDPERVRQGRGLRNMRARAEELGGTLQITSGEGTAIRLHLPA